jgi:hypothetical protein
MISQSAAACLMKVKPSPFFRLNAMELIQHRENPQMLIHKDSGRSAQAERDAVEEENIFPSPRKARA